MFCFHVVGHYDQKYHTTVEPEYSRRTYVLLLIPRLLASPGHQQLWYWPRRMNKSFSSTGKYLHYVHQVLENMKCKYNKTCLSTLSFATSCIPSVSMAESMVEYISSKESYPYQSPLEVPQDPMCLTPSCASQCICWSTDYQAASGPVALWEQIIRKPGHQQPYDD